MESSFYNCGVGKFSLSMRIRPETVKKKKKKELNLGRDWETDILHKREIRTTLVKSISRKLKCKLRIGKKYLFITSDKRLISRIERLKISVHVKLQKINEQNKYM